MRLNKITTLLFTLAITSAVFFSLPSYAAGANDGGREPAIAAGAFRFTDTADTEIGYAMNYAAEHGYLYIYADNGMAYPNNTLTRGEWAYTLDKWLGYIQPLLTGMGFAPEKQDVLPEDISGHPFYDSIARLAEQGLTEPDAYSFRPDDFVTRQEISDYMARLLPMLGAGPDYALEMEEILDRYGDREDLSSQYEWQIAFMTEAGLIGYSGGEDAEFMPEQPYERGEMCVMFLLAETMIREETRERKEDGLAVSSEMEIESADVKNLTPTSYFLEVTVNEAAREINPHVIVAYTLEEDENPEIDELLSGDYYTQSQRLTEMRRVFTDGDETTYSVTMRGKPDTAYNLFIVLKNGMEYSNIVDYTVNLPEE